MVGSIAAPILVADLGGFGLWAGIGFTLGFLLVAVLLFYLGFPLLILSIFKMNKNPKITDFDVNAVPAPLTESLDYFEEEQGNIEKLGFEFVTNFFIRNLVPTAKMLGQLWYHPASRTAFTITHTYVVNQGNSTMSSQSFEFSTLFNDGTLVDTSNTKDFGSFPHPPFKVRHVLFWERDMEKVFRFHLAICRDVRNAIPVDALDEKFEGDGLEFLGASLKEENFYNVEQGFLRDS
ncbi:MAG: hypothetical protein CMJ46_12665, partial [Planctomyces sp.]|nr:hypothetical protein [Planctomyces sp.]